MILCPRVLLPQQGDNSFLRGKLIVSLNLNAYEGAVEI